MVGGQKGKKRDGPAGTLSVSVFLRLLDLNPQKCIFSIQFLLEAHCKQL